MLISEIITAVDGLKVNEYSTAQKCSFLEQIDRIFLNDLIWPRPNDIYRTQPSSPTAGDLWMDGTTLKRYSGSSWTAVFPYSAGTQQLLLGDDARELYILYVCAQIDFYNGEYDRYNNESAAFNSAYQTFEKAYSRSRLQYRKFKNL